MAGLTAEPEVGGTVHVTESPTRWSVWIRHEDGYGEPADGGPRLTWQEILSLGKVIR